MKDFLALEKETLERADLFLLLLLLHLDEMPGAAAAI